MTTEPFIIDGSTLEGGGQILRNTIAYSALLGKPVTIRNIRKGRAQPGLKSQHAAGILLAAQICDAHHEGVSIGSEQVTFIPRSKVPTSCSFTADALTAGSTTLLFQIALPILLFASSSEPIILTLKGGTNALLAPQIDYTQNVFLPLLHTHFHLPSPSQIQLQTDRRGYYPKGGGLLACTIHPLSGSPLSPINLLERGEVMSVEGISHVKGLPLLLAKNMAKGATSSLTSLVREAKIDIKSIKEDSPGNPKAAGPGSGIVLWACTSTGCLFGGSAVGKKGIDPSSVGAQAAEELVRGLRWAGVESDRQKELGEVDDERTGGEAPGAPCVDEYTQDQIIIFMALAKGASAVRTGPLTLHTKTAIWVAEQMTDAKFDVTDDGRGSCMIRCQGIGLGAGEV